MRYGMPYKGSKNQIAEWVVSQFPEKENFYDLFAGGCAVTHAAFLSGKYRNFFANDITDYPQMFLKAIIGGFKNERRWISREDFCNLKDKEPYIKYCWSFGNAGKQYLYSKEIEPWKKALHYARVLGDFSLLKEFGIDMDNPFDHDSFYKWCSEQKELVIISEYNMADDFICIGEIEKSVLFCSGSAKKTVERLFIPRHQKEYWDRIKGKKWVQLELFPASELMCR